MSRHLPLILLSVALTLSTLMAPRFALAQQTDAVLVAD